MTDTQTDSSTSKTENSDTASAQVPTSEHEASTPTLASQNLHPQPGQMNGETLRAEPDAVRDRDWPTAGYAPEDVFLKELALEEAKDIEAARVRDTPIPADLG